MLLQASSCVTKETISSELSSRLSLPFASIAARSLSSKAVAPDVDGVFPAANGLGIWKDVKAAAGEMLEQNAVIATVAAAARDREATIFVGVLC